VTPEARAAADAALNEASAHHIPVLCAEVIEALDPSAGDVILDGTFGAGGYSRALLDAADCHVIGLDRDPDALAEAELWTPLYDGRLSLVQSTSMQLDRARRGFSFLRDGPLDMRMAQDGPSAADIVNSADESALADIFFQYGEERRSRALARAVVQARKSESTSSNASISGAPHRGK